jgi:hypothetical protein
LNAILEMNTREALVHDNARVLLPTAGLTNPHSSLLLPAWDPVSEVMIRVMAWFDPPLSHVIVIAVGVVAGASHPRVTTSAICVPAAIVIPV